MPFKSEAQRKFLFAVKPEIAREFAEKTKKMASLPDKKRNNNRTPVKPRAVA